MTATSEHRDMSADAPSPAPAFSERGDRLIRLAEVVLSPLAAVIAGLAVGAIAVVLSGHGVLSTYSAMVRGVVSNSFLISAWLQRATPIVLAAVGAGVAFRAGLFNVGLEAQLVAGAMAAAVAGVSMPVAGPPAIVAALIAGALAGGVMGWVPGILRAKLGVNLVVSTLLSNYVVDYVASYLAAGPLRDRSGANALAQTRMLPTSSQFGSIVPGTDFNFGMIVAVAVVLVAALMTRSSIPGFETRMRGLNPRFTLVVGVEVERQTSRIMAVSGALVGLGGALATLGTYDRFIDGALTGPGVAWTGLAAALMGGSEVSAATVAALLLAGIQAGANFMSATTNVSLELGDVIQGTIVVFVAARAGFGLWLQNAVTRLRRRAGTSR